MSKKTIGYFSNWIDLENVKSKYEGYTDIIFAFWQDPTTGVSGAAEAAINNKSEILTFLKSKNKKCILAAGGANLQNPLQFDAQKFGTELAKFAIEHNFDGVDLDIENLITPPTSVEINWLVEVTKAVKSTGKDLLISHAPQATYFVNNGGYSLVEKETNGIVDYYNIQFYNQGTWEYQSYENYESMFESSYNNIPNTTSIPSIIEQGVPSEKLIVGKPITAQDMGGSDSTGYIPLEQLTQIIDQAINNNIPFGGVMGWKIDSDIDGIWGKTIEKTLSGKNASIEV